MTVTTGQAPRTLFARRPGRAAGGLVFRVGLADETLATSGITSLVVALALRAVERPGLDVEAWVDPALTRVTVQGSGERVLTTLHDLSRAFAALPVARRATEARALSERSAEGVGVQGWRYGLQGYGLGPGHYLGLHRVSDAHLQEWAATRFAGSNAAAWYVGEDEPVLDLPLPAGDGGPRLPPAVPAPAPWLPAEAPAGGTRVLWDAVVPDAPGLPLLAEVARRALFRTVRQDHGWTYDVTAMVSPLDGRLASLQIAAGLRPETAAQATGEFLDTIGRLRYSVSEQELSAARAHLLAPYDEPHQEAVWLPDAAALTLMGRPLPTPAERRAAIVEVTVADVVALAGQVWDSGLLVTPVGAGWAGTALVRRGSGEAVTGRAFERLDADATIVVGAEGATLRDGRTRTTVRFAHTAALLAYPDGGRLLIGLDGARVPFEPSLHDDLRTADLAELVDRHVPAELVVPVPRAQAPERPDRQRIKQAARGRPSGRLSRSETVRLLGVVALVMALLVAVVGALVCGGGLLLTLAAWLDEGPQPWGFPVLMVSLGAGFCTLAWLCFRGILRLRV